MTTVTVALIGEFPKTVRAACLESSAAAGVIPAAAFRVGRKSAVVLGSGSALAVYLRWRGVARPVVTWTTDPFIFSKAWRGKCQRAMREMLADPAVKRSSVRLGRKPPGGASNPDTVS